MSKYITCLMCNKEKLVDNYYATRTKYCSVDCERKSRSNSIKENKEKNFLKKIQKLESGCWQWTATKDKDGYGKMLIEGKYYRAHRISYELYKGEIDEGLWVLHTCDLTGCVNPDHLYLGTNIENVRDRESRGRGLTGRKLDKTKYKRGDQHYSKTNPEKVCRGENHWRVKNPELFDMSGENHWTKKNPEKVKRGHKMTNTENHKRGDEHYSRTNPEKLRRGENHPSKLYPDMLPKGSNHHGAKINEEIAKQIKILKKQGLSCKQIYQTLNLSKGIVYPIFIGRTWQHVKID